YHDANTAREIDRRTADALVALRAADVGPEHACGAYAVRGLLRFAGRRGWQGFVIDLRNSGDTAGPRQGVVGCGAFGFPPRAAANVPPNLPAVATTRISPHTSHGSAPATRPTRVRMPVKAKNAGKSSTVTRSSSLCVNARATALSCGMTAPSRNAPKRAWM